MKCRPSHSGLRRRGYPGGEQEIETIEVPVEDLDSSLPDGFVPVLIKIDVEGAELEVLRGALGTLTRHRPVVVFDTSETRHITTGPRPLTSEDPVHAAESRYANRGAEAWDPARDQLQDLDPNAPARQQRNDAQVDLPKDRVQVVGEAMHRDAVEAVTRRYVRRSTLAHDEESDGGRSLTNPWPAATYQNSVSSHAAASVIRHLSRPPTAGAARSA